jgi:hemolysin III
MNSASVPALAKPKLRGHFHQAAFFFAFGACSMLLAKTIDTRSFFALLIYSLSLLTLFGVSALYHRIQWNPNQRLWMRRLDHSAIFILIAGTGTPLFLLALPEVSGHKLLLLTWSTTVLGIMQSLFWPKAPKWISAILYIFAGWIIAPYLPELKAALGDTSLIFLFTGGVLYTLGAVIYALHKPNPWPKYFGYHEVFHLLVMVAAFFHFLTVYRLLVVN